MPSPTVGHHETFWLLSEQIANKFHKFCPHLSN